MTLPLSIPDLPDDCSTITAALAYANAGWYVGPCTNDGKHPGSLLGKGWPEQTSRDPEQIVAWWAGTDHGLFLHVGRSGGLVMDVDKPQAMPPLLRDAIALLDPPFQSTRANDPERGHYVFLMPDDRMISAGLGELGKGWGEVRGRNSVIIVQPTRHEKVDEGGRYLWQRTGEVPYSPELAAALPDAADSADPATDAVVSAFLAANTDDEQPALLGVVLERFDADVAAGGARHDALRDCAIWACREAYAGRYPAKRAMESLWRRFSKAMKANPTPGRFPSSEFRGVFAWAVAQALLTDPEERRREIADRLAEVEFMARKPAPIVPDPAAVPEVPAPRDPAAYFRDKEAGIDVALLADDVLAMGPLRVGRDGLFWRYSGGVWREARDEVRGRCTELLRGRYRGSHATNTEHVVHRRVGRIDADPVRDYINLRGDETGAGGGMLDWRTGELHPWSPDHLSTVQLPVAWNPEATCPRFDAFLSQVLSPEAVELAWEMLGYLMMNGNPLHTAFMFYGGGRNGKGTLIRVIEGLLGAENISSVSLDLLNNNRFAPAALYGKVANIAGDVDATYQESTAALKSLTGEDVFRGENKHRDGFQFTSWAVPLFSANEIPGSADVSTGYLSRWTVLHFTRSFQGAAQVLNLSDLLLQELDGIAHKAVLALRTLMARGGWDKSKGDVAAAQDEFAMKIDAVRQWLDAVAITVNSECITTDEERHTISEHRENRADVYVSFRHWHGMNNPGSRCMSAAKFYARLEGIPGLRLYKRDDVRWVQGLRLVEGRMLAEPSQGLLAVDE